MDAPRCFARACGPARSRSAWGAAAPRRFAPLRGLAPSPGGLRPGSRGRKGPTRAACLGAASRALGISGCARRPAGPSSLGFSGRPFAPLRVLPGRGPCPCPRPLRARRARFARLAALSPRSPARPLVRRCAAPRALAGPGPLAVPSAPLRASCGRPCFSPGRLCGCRGPAGGRLRPLRGKGRARSAPAPLRPLRAAFPPPGGRGLVGCARPPAAACCASPGALRWSWGSPLRPPAPPPPLGAPGSAWLAGRGACGPPPGVCFSQPFPGGPPGDGRAPRGVSPRLTVRKLSTRVFRPPPCLPFYRPRQGFPSARCLGLVAQARGLDPAGVGFSAAGGLTFPARCAILFVRGSLAAPPGAALLGVQGARESRSAEKQGGFFSAPGIPPAVPEVYPSIAPAALLLLDNRSVKARLTQQNLCHFVALAPWNIQ